MQIHRLKSWWRDLDIAPVLQKETQTTARSIKFLAFLLITLALSSIILVVLLHNKSILLGNTVLPRGATGSQGMIGLLIFQTIYLAQVATIALAIPAYAAGSICTERFRKTFNLLIITSLRPADIIMGKYSAVMVNVVLFIAAFLPLTAVCVPFGAVDPQMVLWLYFYLFGNASVTAMLCIAISAGTRNPVTATGASYLATLVLTFIWMAPALPNFQEHSILSINTFGVAITTFLYSVLFYAVAVALIQPRPFFIPVVGELGEQEIKKRLGNEKLLWKK